MASFHVLRTGLTPVTVSQSNFSKKSTCFFPESSAGKRIFKRRSFGGSRFCMSRRLKISCGAQEKGDQSNEERPESLFMKELRRRGMTPTSLLEDLKSVNNGLETEIKVDGDKRDPSVKNAVSAELGNNVTEQRQRSMELNSEGLEGLVPRAKLLLRLGGTFFLGFWPLILITVASFSALYSYFGPAFVHDGNETSMSSAQYTDPYALLEDKRISQIAPPVN